MGFVSQAKASFAATDDQWKRIAARELYPTEPVEVAAKRFGRTADGRMFHRGQDGKTYEIQARSGVGRLANIGEGVGGALPAVAGGVAGILGGMYTGGVGGIAAAGGGAYAGETGRQFIGNALDPGKGSEYNVGRAAMEGVGGAIGQGIGVGLNRFTTRFNPSDIAHFNPQQATQLADTAERMGVRLTPAESTGLASLEAEQKRLTASPRSANTMREFYDTRNREVGDAWQSFLDRISPARDASALGRQAGQIADNILTNAQAARTQAVEPFYQQAERQIGYVNPGQIVQFIEQALPNAKGSERSALQFARSQLSLTGQPDTVDMSFRGLNGVKMAIDGVLENPDLAMKQGLDRTAHRTLQAVREMVVNAIENSPADPNGLGRAAYQAGRQGYEMLSNSAVTPIKEVLAPLLRVNPSNSSVIKTAEAVLNPATRSPQLVAEARRMISQQHPDVWNGMVRQFLQDHAVTALQENAKGTVSNVGGNIAKRVGNDLMEANLRAAMTPQQFREYRDIVDVFRATGRAVDANSDTAFKQEAIKRAKAQAGGILGRLGTAIENVNPARLLANTAEFFRNANYEQQAQTIANIYASGNRDAIAALRQLRQLSPADVRRQMIMGHMIERFGENAAPKALDYVTQ